MATSFASQRVITDSFPELSLLRVRDEAAWDAAFRHLWPVAMRAAQHPRAGLSHQEAEEIASETLAALIPQVGKIASVDQLKALTATIAYRGAVSLLRRKLADKRRPEFTGDVGGPYARGACQDSGGPPTPRSEVELQEMVQLLRRALEGLDPETRLLLEEKTIHGLTYQDLSERHQIPMGTACTKVARGVARVRDTLRKSPGLWKELEAFLR